MLVESPGDELLCDLTDLSFCSYVKNKMVLILYWHLGMEHRLFLIIN